MDIKHTAQKVNNNKKSFGTRMVGFIEPQSRKLNDYPTYIPLLIPHNNLDVMDKNIKKDDLPDLEEVHGLEEVSDSEVSELEGPSLKEQGFEVFRKRIRLSDSYDMLWTRSTLDEKEIKKDDSSTVFDSRRIKLLASLLSKDDIRYLIGLG